MFFWYFSLEVQYREGGYDQKVNETVSVVTAKTTEIGQKTWGIMKGVMALASQKVEEFSKDGGTSWMSGYQQYQSSQNGLLSHETDYEEIKHGDSWGSKDDYGGSRWDDWDQSLVNKNASSKGVSGNLSKESSQSFNKWDDWDNTPRSKTADNTGTTKTSHASAAAHTGGGDSWAGWDDVKDEGDDDFFGGSRHQSQRKEWDQPANENGSNAMSFYHIDHGQLAFPTVDFSWLP